MSKISKRSGKFFIGFDLIEAQPEMVLLMLSGKLIVRAEARYEMAAIEYHAYCDDFDEIEQGQQIPEYVAEFSQQKVEEKDPDDPTRSKIKIISVFQRWVKVKV